MPNQNEVPAAEMKLYVGNLAYSTTEADLRQLFAQAGNVISAELVKDPGSGQSKGFAFVTMGTPAEAQKAIDMFHAYSLADRELRVARPKPKEEPSAARSQLSAFSGAGQKSRGQPSKPRPRQGGYQGKLSAFGNDSGPVGPRRRGGGGSQRH